MNLEYMYKLTVAMTTTKTATVVARVGLLVISRTILDKIQIPNLISN